MEESELATPSDAIDGVADSQPVTLPDNATAASEPAINFDPTPPHMRYAAPEPVRPVAARGPDDDLAEYDRETATLIQQAAELVAEAQEAAKSSRAVAASWRKQQRTSEAALLALIGERKEQRGRPTLMDFAGRPRGPRTPDPAAWRKRPLADLDSLTSAVRNTIKSFMVDTLGDLHDELAGGQTFGFTLGIVSDIRGELEHFLDGLAIRVDAGKQPATDPELWRQYPIERWTEFGLTDGDVKRLHAGEIKSGGCHPIVTVGDLNLFVTPNPANPSFARGYKDIKGIGAAGCDRISEAETRFWAAWGSRLELEFAQERGLIRGAETVAGTDGGVSVAGDLDGAGGDAADVFDLDTAEGRAKYAEECRDDPEALAELAGAEA